MTILEIFSFLSLIMKIKKILNIFLNLKIFMYICYALYMNI